MAPTATCIFFLQNRCRRGTECTFRHEVPNAQSASASTQHQRRPGNGAASSESTLAMTPVRAPNRGLLIPCRFFQAGYCIRGESCHYAHVAPASSATEASRTASSNDEISEKGNAIGENLINSINDNSTEVRVMGATLSVSFGTGFEITDVGSATATSIITIHHLPSDINTNAVGDLLSPFEKNLATDTIRLIALEDSTYATVKMKDAVTAENVVTTLDNTEYQGFRLSIKLYHPRGLSNISQSTTRVSCSWFPASVVASVTFSTMRKALKAWDATKDKSLRGRKVDCKYPTVSHSNEATMSVGNLPSNVKKNELRKLISGIRSEYMHSPNYELTSEEVLAHVVSLIQQGPPVIESYEIVTPPNAPKTKAVIRFTSEAAASRAVEWFNERKQKFLGDGPLYLQTIYTANFKISLDIYRAVAADLTALQAEHIEKVRIGIFGAGKAQGGSRHLVTVRLNGQNKRDVGEVKALVGKLVRGQLCLLENEPIPLWDKFFTTTTGIHKVNDIARETDTFIFCDRRKCQIFLFGTENNRNKVSGILQQLLVSLRESALYEIHLSGDKWREFIREQLKTLREAFGQEKVNVNIVKRCIEFHGSLDEFEHFRTAISPSENESKDKGKGPTRVESPGECPICFDTAENPTRISSSSDCEHVYCTTCLRDYINSTGETRKFPITCVGMSTRDSNALCPARLDLKIATTILSPMELDSILNTAFTSYIRRRPNEYLYCPTANCSTVYRPSSNNTFGQILTCVECLLEICMGCNVEAHHGVTCDEYKLVNHHDENAEKEYGEWRRLNGVQACPRCKTDIQKIDGCNHITCGGCRTHICWKCLAMFEESDEVYPHMRSTHGGIGMGYEDED